MYVEPWIFWLILAPIGAVSALYIGYGAMILLGLLSLSIGLGFSLASAWLSNIPALGTRLLARLITWCLGPLVRPFRRYGPWLDYAVVAGIAVALSLGAVLWLAA